MTDVLISESARDELDALDPPVQDRITEKLLHDVAERPDLRLKRLSNSELYRARIGDYRVRIDWSKETDTLRVLEIGTRENFYE